MQWILENILLTVSTFLSDHSNILCNIIYLLHTISNLNKTIFAHAHMDTHVNVSLGS